MTQPTLEPALRRATLWARRGMPLTAAELLSGTDGVLQYRPDRETSLRRSRAARRCASQLSPARRQVTITRTAADYEIGRLGGPAAASGGTRRVSADTSSLAGALALAFGHGPLAGIAPALVAEREGAAFRVRACWGAPRRLGRARGARRHARRLSREDRPAGLAALAGARGGRRVALTVKVAGWLVFARRVVDRDGNLCAITTWGQPGPSAGDCVGGWHARTTMEPVAWRPGRRWKSHDATAWRLCCE